MNQQQQEDLIEQQADVIEDLRLIIEDLRLILIGEGPDSEILQAARVALGSWFAGTYPHLHPGQDRPQLHLIKGQGRRSRSARQSPLLSSVEETP
jgi:hypothetical protein